MRLNKKPANEDTRQEEFLTSRLLPEVFDGYQPGEKLAVLDLGGGNARTVSFLSQYQARVSFVDLLEHSEELQNPELSPAQSLATCTRLLNLPAGAKYDIILLWDIVHHLPLGMLEALSSVLEPHTMKHTRGYGFGSLQADRVHEPFEYGIQSAEQITLTPSELPAFAAHSQQQMNQKFLCMHIAKATLLREGKLELLFERH